MYKLSICTLAIFTTTLLGAYELPANYGPPPVPGTQSGPAPTVIYEAPPSSTTNYQKEKPKPEVKKKPEAKTKSEKQKSSYEQAFDKPYGPPK